MTVSSKRDYSPATSPVKWYAIAHPINSVKYYNYSEVEHKVKNCKNLIITGNSSYILRGSFCNIFRFNFSHACNAWPMKLTAIFLIKFIIFRKNIVFGESCHLHFTYKVVKNVLIFINKYVNVTHIQGMSRRVPIRVYREA